MRRASTLFSDEQKKRIDEAVSRAEAGTSAEIVPVVATDSGRYDRAEDIVGLWLGLIALCAAWALLPRAEQEPGSWAGRSAVFDLAILVAVTVGGFIIGAVVASRVGWLRGLFTPRRQMCDEVRHRAQQVFFDGRMHHTAGRTGLLIYVSLYERLAVILGDQSIVDQLGQQSLNDMCSHLTGRLKSGDVAGAICAEIEEAGKRLAVVLPITTDDRNEVANALITLD